MTHDDRSLERAARSWLEEGPIQAPDRAVQGALSRIHTIRQERALVPWRLPSMNPIARIAAVAVMALLTVGLASVTIGPGGPWGPKPTATPPPPIAPGEYAVDLPVAGILANLDASTLSESEKQSVIDSILVIRGATTLNLRLSVTPQRFILRQGTDGGTLTANPPWHITRNDGGTLAFDQIPAGASTAEYQVVRGADGQSFTLRAVTAAGSPVEAFVREILFNTGPYLPVR
jgi:hypothetical protein